MFKNKKIAKNLATLVVACTFLQTVANSQEVTVNNDFQNKAVQTQNDSIVSMLKAMDAKNQAQFNSMNNEILTIKKTQVCTNVGLTYAPTHTNADKNGCIPDFSVHVGTILAWPSGTKPNGWLECNGSTFNTTTYPKLAAVLGGNRLPDLRGEFIRGWDHGRGVDSGRGIKTFQGDAIRNITGSSVIIHSQTAGLTQGYSGAIQTVNAGVPGDDGSTKAAAGSYFNFDASRVVPTAPDNRPRNVAFMYIIKAQ